MSDAARAPITRAAETLRPRRVRASNEELAAVEFTMTPTAPLLPEVNTGILPAEVPEIRERLRDRWTDGSYGVPDSATFRHCGYASIARQLDRNLQTDNDVAAYAAWEAHALTHASLWWISAEMLPLLLAAASSVPETVTLADVLMLDRAGLVVLERPWFGLDSVGGTCRVDAFCWKAGLIGTSWSANPQPGVVFSAYNGDQGPRLITTQDERARLASFMVNGRLWLPTGRSSWRFDDKICDEVIPVDDTVHESFMEDRRVLCALMTILAHDGLAEVRTEVAPRGVRRRLGRNGRIGDASYRIVTLRRHSRRDDAVAATGAAVPAHDHRWIVSGHWRRQPYGPGGGLRRLQWINPYIKGPEDTPLQHRDVVHAWRQ